MPASTQHDEALALVVESFAEAFTGRFGDSWSGPAGDLVVAAQGVGGALARRICFRPDGVRVRVEDGAPYDGPVVRITASTTDLRGLGDGTEDGALLYLAARLGVDGEVGFLLALAPYLRVPRTGAPFIDAAALDPEAVAAAIKDVSTEHLDEVMAGGFRDLVLGEVFRRLPEFLDAQKAAGAKVAVGFEVGGRRDGGTDRYLVRVDRGTCVVLPDPLGEHPSDVTLLLDGAQFLRLVLGQINPVRAVLGGQVRIRGELIKALGFNSVMRIPGN